MRRVLPLALLILIAAPLSGCGAVMSTYLILVASSELDGAEAAEAEKYAPYEFTAATQYLYKAREEQGYADFGASIEYAFKAQELAEKGKERAEKVKRDQQPPPGAVTAPLDVEMDDDEVNEGQQQIIIRKKDDGEADSSGAGATEIVPVEPDGDEAEDAPEIMIVPIPIAPAPTSGSEPESGPAPQ